MAAPQHLINHYDRSFDYYYPLYFEHYFKQYLSYYQQAYGLISIVTDPTWTSGPECPCSAEANCEERLPPSDLATEGLRRSLGSLARELEIV